jgi:DNA-binding transcriptional regulator PaaX
MAQTIRSAPLPNGLNPEEKKQYMAGVEKFAEAPMSKSKESFKMAVDRAWELEVYNESYHTAFEQMNKLDPKAYYDGGEVGTDVRLVNWIGQK